MNHARVTTMSKGDELYVTVTCATKHWLKHVIRQVAKQLVYQPTDHWGMVVEVSTSIHPTSSAGLHTATVTLTRKDGRKVSEKLRNAVNRALRLNNVTNVRFEPPLEAQ